MSWILGLCEQIFLFTYLNYENGNDIQGRYFLKNGLKSDPEFIIILEELFPYPYAKKEVQTLIAKYVS